MQDLIGVLLLQEMMRRRKKNRGCLSCLIRWAVLTGTIFIAARNEDKAVAAFAEVGTSLDGIEIIGESGLLAVADAQLAKETAAEVEEQEVEGSTAKPKQATGYEDGKITLELILEDSDGYRTVS